jgi:hypothetical protein
MQGTSKHIKSFSNMFVIGYPAFALMYLLWMLGTRKYLYWDGYNCLNGLIVFFIVIAFLPFLIALFLSSLRTGWRLSASLLSFPLLCTLAAFALDLPFYKQVNETEFGGHKYLLAYHNSIYDEERYDWSLFECAHAGILCKPIPVYSDAYGEFYNETSVTDLIIDDREEELHVLVDDSLLYTVGQPPRQYIPMARSARRGNYTYNLARYEDSANQLVFYNLYECDARYNCTKLPFVYSIPAESAAEIGRFFVEADHNSNEIRVSSQSSEESAQLIFSYGEEPRCYVTACTVPDE